MDTIRSVLCIVLMVGNLHRLTAESHFEEYTYTISQKRQNCYDRQYRHCRGSCFWRSCSIRTSRVCCDYYETVEKTGTKCQTGWRNYPGNCDIPICNQPCAGGKSCISPPQTCECKDGITQGLCSSVGCSNEKNCYPGTCKNGNCICPTGFSGENCQTIELRPDIKNCKMTLYTGEPKKEVKTVHCAQDGQLPEPVWINASQPVEAIMQWRVEYNNYLNVPAGDVARHVRNAPVVFGVTKSSFKTSYSNTNFPCSVSKGQNDNPVSHQDCLVSKQWPEIKTNPIRNNDSMEVTIEAQLGGYKTGSALSSLKNTSNFPKQEFTGVSQIARLAVMFDLEPPVHCLTGKNTEAEAEASCPLFAIDVKNDVTTNPRFDVYFSNWTDMDSGVAEYKTEVYKMQPGEGNFLSNTGNPVSVVTVDTKTNFSTFVLKESGVYAIQLTVTDRAGNMAKARKIILYDEDSKITTHNDKPIKLLQADPSTSGEWLTKFETPRDGANIPLTLEWTGHFSSNGKYGDGWANGVAPINGIIDDRFRFLYGMRSIDRMTISGDGIIVYNLAYVVDKSGGIGLSHRNQIWDSLNDTKKEYKELEIKQLNDGDTIVMWLNANDITGSGNDLVEELRVHVDRSPPSLVNVTFQLKSTDEFTSSFFITVVDEHSGIKNIQLKIQDKTTGYNVVYPVIDSWTVAPTLRDSPGETKRRRKRASSILEPCTPVDKSCYCTPQRICYSKTQEIKIDHCWIDRLAGHSFIISYIVVNSANLETSWKHLDLGELSDIPCRPDKLPGGAVAAIVIAILIGAAILGALIIVIVRVRVYHKPMPAIVRRFQTLTFSKSHENELYLPSEALQAAARPGARPGPVRPEAAQPPQSRGHAQEPYNYYGTDPPPYSSSQASRQGSGRPDLETDSVQVYNHIPKTDFKYEEELKKGRFAVIFKVRLLHARDKCALAAAKKLRSGHDPEDVEVMKQKINFLKHMVPPHTNIVRYVGDSEEIETGNPVLLLEYCEMDLPKWLKDQREINDEALSQMTSIALNIARGMEHLHKHNIIHTRLAARNVLINRSGTDGEIVAKLIGFGPMSKKAMKETPKEWLAPETIESFDQQPVYNKKTDSWSYGIVLWEIFSGGKAPFKDIPRSQLLEHMKSGNRMRRPDDMPQELYDDVCKPCWQISPKVRPEFSEICQSVVSYRDGSEQPLYRPDDDDHSHGQDIYSDAS